MNLETISLPMVQQSLGPSWRKTPKMLKKGGSFYLQLGIFYLQLVLATYGQLAWSFLLTVEIWFGLSAYGGKSVWSFLHTVPPVRKLGLVIFPYGSPRPEIGFGLLCLPFPHRK